jgi:hypothetical protein
VNTTVIHDVLAESQAGKLVFPEVVRRLMCPRFAERRRTRFDIRSS